MLQLAVALSGETDEVSTYFPEWAAKLRQWDSRLEGLLKMVSADMQKVWDDVLASSMQRQEVLAICVGDERSVIVDDDLKIVLDSAD